VSSRASLDYFSRWLTSFTGRRMIDLSLSNYPSEAFIFPTLIVREILQIVGVVLHRSRHKWHIPAQ
jgi:hypothetical protein